VEVGTNENGILSKLFCEGKIKVSEGLNLVRIADSEFNQKPNNPPLFFHHKTLPHPDLISVALVYLL